MIDDQVQSAVDSVIVSGNAPEVAIRLNDIASTKNVSFLKLLDEGDGSMREIFDQMILAEIAANKSSS